MSSDNDAKHAGPPAPFYQPAIRELIKSGDVQEMKKLLDEAKALKSKVGNVDAAIADLEAVLKKISP